MAERHTNDYEPPPGLTTGQLLTVVFVLIVTALVVAIVAIWNGGQPTVSDHQALIRALAQRQYESEEVDKHHNRSLEALQNQIEMLADHIEYMEKRP